MTHLWTTLQRHLVAQEGCYQDIEEWEAEQLTCIEEPQTMYSLVYGPPRSSSVTIFKEDIETTIDDILMEYLQA